MSKENETSVRTLLPLALFIACFTITRVSNSSVNIRPKSPCRTIGLTYMMPFGATWTGVSDAYECVGGTDGPVM